MTTNYGYPRATWEMAKDQAREVLDAIARAPDTMITYTELVQRISAISMQPHEFALAALLGEISADDHASGHGMRSALVVSKDEGLPGSGFFALARQLGEDTSDEMKFWVDQLNLVHNDAAGTQAPGTNDR